MRSHLRLDGKLAGMVWFSWLAIAFCNLYCSTAAQSGGVRSFPETSSRALQPAVPPPDLQQAAGSDQQRAADGSPFALYPPSSTRPVTPVRIYFPPNPPPLGEELEIGGDDFRLDHAQLRSLEGDILEPYYAPLSTRLLEPDHRLTKSQESRLEKRRANRARLLQGLRTRLGELAGAAPDDRRTGLAAFAKIQQAELAAYEAEAEKLRSELARGVSWFDDRRWRLGSGALADRAQTREFESRLLRAVAFYQDGIMPEQRRLLREASQFEEDVEPGERAEPDGRTPFAFFSPDLLPVAFPEDLPAELVEQIALFHREKNAIRRELQEAVYRSERSDNMGARRQELRTLVKRQAPRLRALDDKAEQIRVGLVTHGSTGRRQPLNALPEALEKDLAEYFKAKRRFQDGFALILARNKVTVPSAEIRKDPAALERWIEDRRRYVEEAGEEYEREHVEELARIDALFLSIDERMSPHLLPDEVGVAEGPADTRLEQFVRRRSEVQAYYEYELAAFEPGLSPEQRRLLFAAAVVHLDLPLGVPEVQPMAALEVLER